jgi:hypothetical protein
VEHLTSLVIVLFILGLIFYFSHKGRLQRQEQARALRVQQEQFAHDAIEKLEAAGGDLTKLPDLSREVTSLILHPGERCFAICRGAQRVVEAHQTKYVGGSQGVSFRIAKGVRYHVGGFSGHPVTTAYEKVQDVGDLYVTTERVVFAGSREVTSVAGKKVADVRIDGDHIWVMAENRKTPLGLKLAPAVAPVMAYAARLLAESSQNAPGPAGSAQ